MPTAPHIEAVYGQAVLASEVGRAGAYAAVVDPLAWELCAPRLPAPAALIAPTSLEEAELDSLCGDVPAGATVVGIGGGLAMDAAKYLARGGLAILAPSLTSSNAPFSDTIAVRRDGEPVGAVRRGQCKRIIVDYTLIGAADPQLNRPGYADLLAHEIAVADAFAADPEPGDEVRSAREQLRTLARRARSDAPLVAEMGPAGIETLMRRFHQATAVLAEAPELGSGSEHLIAWTLEATTARHFRHGEAVALGIVVAAHLQGGDVAGLQGALRAARVPFRPAELGLSWDELEHALTAVPDYNRRVRQIASVIGERTWTPGRLSAVRDLLGC